MINTTTSTSISVKPRSAGVCGSMSVITASIVPQWVPQANEGRTKAAPNLQRPPRGHAPRLVAVPGVGSPGQVRERCGARTRALETRD